MTDRALYVAMTGPSAMLRGQASGANNLANAESVGFQATLAWPRSMALAPVIAT